MLETVLGPFHRPPDSHRRSDDGDVLAGHPVFQAEPAADVAGEDADLLHRHVDLQRQEDPVHVRRLRRRVDREVLSVAVPDRDQAPAFHRHRLVAVHADAGPDHPVGLGEGALHVAACHFAGEGDVVAELGEQWRLGRVQGVGV